MRKFEKLSNSPRVRHLVSGLCGAELMSLCLSKTLSYYTLPKNNDEERKNKINKGGINFLHCSEVT